MAFYSPQIDRREAPIDLRSAAALFIDIQNYNCHRAGAIFRYFSPEQVEGPELQYFWDRIDNITGNLKRLQSICRESGVEAMYTVIQSLTKDGRDRSLDYKISGFHVPPGSWDAKVLDCIQPGSDEIIIPKTSSSVFMSTNIEYILKCMEKKYLIICGCLTDQCVEHAVRDACDLGYLVTVVPDCCATYSEDRHNRSLQAIKGYCRIRTVSELVDEFRASRAGLPMQSLSKGKRPFSSTSLTGVPMTVDTSPMPETSGSLQPLSPGNGDPNSAHRPKRERKIYFEFAKKQWETEEEFRLPSGSTWVEVAVKGNPASEDRGLVFCRLCRENGRSNIFAKGYVGGKRSALKEHMTTKDHKDALRILGHDIPNTLGSLGQSHPDHPPTSTSPQTQDGNGPPSPRSNPADPAQVATDWERTAAVLQAAVAAGGHRPLLPNSGGPLDLPRPSSQGTVPVWAKLDAASQELASVARQVLPPTLPPLPVALQQPGPQPGMLRKPPSLPHAAPGSPSRS